MAEFTKKARANISYRVQYGFWKDPRRFDELLAEFVRLRDSFDEVVLHSAYTHAVRSLEVIADDMPEFNLAIDPPKFAEAKRNYLIVVDRYPNSAKASTALYQLYNISKDVEKNATLASQYKTKLLKNYPKAEEIKFLK